MSIYIAISIISSMLSLLSYTKKRDTVIIFGKKRAKLLHVLSSCLILMLFFIMALRDVSVGIDTDTYSRIYSRICESDTIIEAIGNTSFSGPIYILLCWLLSRVTKSFQLVLFISALVVNLGLFRFLNKVSKNIAMSIFIWIGIGMFYFSMNGNRQTMAAVTNLNAFELILKEGKWTQGIILMLIAAGIHPTSIIMGLVLVGAYWAEKISNTKRVFEISLLAGIAAGFGFNTLILLVLKLLPQYMKYTDSQDGRPTIFEQSGGGRILYIYLILLIFAAFWCEIRDFKGIEIENRFFPTIVFSLAFAIINSKNVYVSRMILYYLILYCVFFPAMITRLKKKQRIVNAGVNFCVVGV